MIPLKLSLSNFICYRENVPTLDFTGVHVACLCGGNGHGKSALLDGITWALWGKARAKTQDELISYGADECRVELDFSSRGQAYRVVRSHARGGRRRRGSSELQLTLLDGEVPVPLTGNRSRETQARIDQTIGMDYETFVNSALLVQGRADEFTNRTPAERKAVLGKILGLGAYDRLQSLAKDRGDLARAASAGAEANAERIGQELTQLEAAPAALAAVETRLEGLEEQLTVQRAKTTALAEEISALRTLQARRQESVDRLDSLSRELVNLEASESSGQEQVARYESLLEQAQAVRAGAARLAEARRGFQEMEQKRSEYEALETERTKLQGAIEVRRARLESDIGQVRLDIGRLTPKAEDLEGLEAELLLVQSEDTGFDAERREIAESRELINTLSQQMGQLDGSVERFTSEGQQLAGKLKMLQQSGEGGAVCPLCQTRLGADGRHHLEDSYNQEIESKRQEYRLASAQLKELQGQHEELQKQAPLREKQLADAHTRRQVKLNGLTTRIEESRASVEELRRLVRVLEQQEQSLRDSSFAVDETARLVILKGRAAALAYDEEVRQRRYQETRELEPFALKEQILDRAETELPAARAELARTGQMVQDRKEQAARLHQELADGETALATLPVLESARLAEGQKQAAIEAEAQNVRSQQGKLREQVDRRDRLAGELQAESKRLAQQRDEQSVYQELQAAFGKRGVQAMLIETVVPRIEDEANALLGRMTDHRMNVKLETQVEAASGRGEPTETLQIQVSDELGPRSYEMYSGGEAFRVNLALRIALSRVLAQRMGAPLPTLFIDEGFGTQDAAGRERILDVIGFIGEEFDKVIVITHLDDLKEAFPTRIEVHKESGGSTFWLS